MSNEAEDLAPEDGGQENTDQTTTPEVSAETLAKAEKMGWTPKDQFKGDPAKWRPADEFVERGENMLPLVRATVRRQEQQIKELQNTVKEFAEFSTKTEQRAYDKALTTLREQRAAAIAAGDGATFDKVDGRIDELKKEIDAKANKAKDTSEKPDPEFEEWIGRNKWAEDEELQIVGAAIGEAIHKKNPGIARMELLEDVAKEIKRRYPERFENQRRNAAPAVEGGAPPRKTGKGFADLPAEARAACERMARNGFDGKPKEVIDAFKANYVKNYFEGA